MSAPQLQAQAIEIGHAAAAHVAHQPRRALRFLSLLSSVTDGQIQLRKLTPMVGAGGAIGPMHIAMVGEWKGHPAGGFTVTEADIDTMIERFDAQQNAMMVDYEHRSLNATGSTSDGEAAGWIHKLEKKQGESGPELWAMVEWTAEAADRIRGGKYRYCSPVLDYAATDRKSGEPVSIELFNVAVTNNPFLDGQQPITLSRVTAAISGAEPEPAPGPQEPRPNMPPAAPPPAADPQADMQAMSEQLTAFIDSIAKTANVDRAAVVAALNEMTDDIAGRVREHLDQDGMPQEEPMVDKEPAPAAADDTSRADEIEARAKQNDQTIVLKRVDEMETKLSAIETERQAEKEAAKAAKDASEAKHIAAMVDDGKLLDTERDDALWLLSNQPERFERVYASRKGSGKAVPIGVSQAGHEQLDPETVQLSDLSAGDQVAYKLLTNNGMKGEHALKRIAEKHNTSRKAG